MLDKHSLDSRTNLNIAWLERNRCLELIRLNLLNLIRLGIRVSPYLLCNKRKIRVWIERRKIMDNQDFRGLIITCNTWP